MVPLHVVESSSLLCRLPLPYELAFFDVQLHGVSAFFDTV